jgi:ribosomal-protein-alanine N-acetyltransferase
VIAVSPATPTDAAAIARLSRTTHALHAAALPHLFQPPGAAVVTAAEVERLIASGDRLLLVATADGAVAGYASAEEERVPATALKRATAVLHLHELAVHPAHRRRGIGRLLLRAVRDAAATRGLATVSLDVYAFNAEARALYEAEGFAPLRTRYSAPATPPPTG